NRLPVTLRKLQRRIMLNPRGATRKEIQFRGYGSGEKLLTGLILHDPPDLEIANGTMADVLHFNLWSPRLRGGNRSRAACRANRLAGKVEESEAHGAFGFLRCGPPARHLHIHLGPLRQSRLDIAQMPAESVEACGVVESPEILAVAPCFQFPHRHR